MRRNFQEELNLTKNPGGCYGKLLLISRGSKTMRSMANEVGASYRKVLSSITSMSEKIEETEESLISTIKNQATVEKQNALLIDFTNINKPFSMKIEKVTYDYDGSSKSIRKGLSAGFSAWTNGKVVIPFGVPKGI